MRRMAIALLAVIWSPLVSASGPVALIDPPPVAIPAQRTTEQIDGAIKAAFGHNQWYVLQQDSGHLVMCYEDIDGHLAKADVNWSAAEVSIRYLDSVGLDYEELNGRRRIHKYYNRWITSIASDLAEYLTNGIPQDMDFPTREAEKFATIKGAVVGGHTVARGLNQTVFIGYVDGKRGGGNEIQVKAGKHRLDLTYFLAGAFATAHVWFVAAPGGHYSASFERQEMRVRLFLIDDATGMETGGIQGSDDEPDKPQ